MAAAAALAEVDTDVLVAELKRRLDCATKPEKHVILIGPHPPGDGRKPS